MTDEEMKRMRDDLETRYDAMLKGKVPDHITTREGVTVSVVDADECVCRICGGPFLRLTTQAFDASGNPIGSPKPMHKTVCAKCRTAMDVRSWMYEMDPRKAREMDEAGVFQSLGGNPGNGGKT